MTLKSSDNSPRVRLIPALAGRLAATGLLLMAICHPAAAQQSPSPGKAAKAKPASAPKDGLVHHTGSPRFLQAFQVRYMKGVENGLWQVRSSGVLDGYRLDQSGEGFFFSRREGVGRVPVLECKYKNMDGVGGDIMVFWKDKIPALTKDEIETLPGQFYNDWGFKLEMLVDLQRGQCPSTFLEATRLRDQAEAGLIAAAHQQNGTSGRPTSADRTANPREVAAETASERGVREFNEQQRQQNCLARAGATLFGSLCYNK